MLPDLHSLALFMAATLLLNVTPGPDMMFIAARSAAEGRGVGLASAFGVATGSLIHIALVALGLAVLLTTVPMASTAIRWAGALYLIYLGIRALRTPQVLTEGNAAVIGRARAFRQGVLTNLLNPKVVLFYLAFLPQFVDPVRGHTALQIVSLGLLVNVSGTAVNVLVALGASSLAGRLRRAQRTGKALQQATGLLFVALGARLALGPVR